MSLGAAWFSAAETDVCSAMKHSNLTQEGALATKDLGVAAGRSTSTRGRPRLKSIGPIAFGPDGILFVADNAAAAVYAFALTGTGEAITQPPEVDGLDRRLAGFLGCDVADIVIRDLAVDPVRQAVYLALTRGHGDQALPVLIRLGPTSDLVEVSLDDVAFSSTSIDDAPAENDARLDTRSSPPARRARESKRGSTQGSTCVLRARSCARLL